MANKGNGISASTAWTLVGGSVAVVFLSLGIYCICKGYIETSIALLIIATVISLIVIVTAVRNTNENKRSAEVNRLAEQRKLEEDIIRQEEEKKRKEEEKKLQEELKRKKEYEESLFGDVDVPHVTKNSK